jgi:hypothetical protein
LSYEDFEMGKPHNIWKSCGSELYAVKKNSINSKIAYGIYTSN